MHKALLVMMVCHQLSNANCTNTSDHIMSSIKSTLNSNTDMESPVVSFTYVLVTFSVDISSFLNKVLHYVKFATVSCRM